MRIPLVSCEPTGGSFHGRFGYVLSCITPERLLENPGQHAPASDRWRKAHEKNVRFLGLLSHWESPLVLELHIVSRPSSDGYRPGKIGIGLLCHVIGATRDQAIETALSTGVRLAPLLELFWSNAEFQCVDPGGFAEYFRPFHPGSCIVVERRIVQHRLSEANPFNVSKIGFMNGDAKSLRDIPPRTHTGIRHVCPWVAPTCEDWSALLNALLETPTPRWIVVRISAAETARVSDAVATLVSAVNECEAFLARESHPETLLVSQAQAIRDVESKKLHQITQGAFRGAVLLFAPGAADDVTANILGQSLTGGPALIADKGRICPANPQAEGGFTTRCVDPVGALNHLDFCQSELLTYDEAACAFRLPLILGDRNLGLPVRMHRMLEASLVPAGEPGLTTSLGINQCGDTEREISISPDDRMKHIFLIGQTGVGKSTWMLNCVLQDLEQGHGVFLVDPHGDLVRDVLARYPKAREDDLILLDFADTTRPIPLNLLAWRTREDRDLIIDELHRSVLQVYGSHPDAFGPGFERYFRTILKLLMGDETPRPHTFTMLEFPRVFQDRAFRKFLLNSICDEQDIVAVEEMQKVTGDWALHNFAPYVTSKLSRFLHEPLLQRMLGHGEMRLNFREILDKGSVVLVNLARGRFGTTVSNLITSQIVGRLRLAAMSRANISWQERRPFFLYIDECNSVAADTDTISNLLSESRKYRVGMVLATQFASQLRNDRSADTLSAVLGNVGTIICFRVGAEDAPLLAKALAPAVSSEDLMRCPNWQGYMHVQLSRFPTQTFSFASSPVRQPFEAIRIRQLTQLSRRKWGVPVEEIDARMKERRRFILSLPDAVGINLKEQEVGQH